MPWSTQCVNVMLLLLSIDLISLPKISHPKSHLSNWKYRFLAIAGLEYLPKWRRCLVWSISITKMEFNMYLNTQTQPKQHFLFAQQSVRQLPGQPCLGPYIFFTFKRWGMLIFRVINVLAPEQRKSTLYYLFFIYKYFCYVKIFFLSMKSSISIF